MKCELCSNELDPCKDRIESCAICDRNVCEDCVYNPVMGPWECKDSAYCEQVEQEMLDGSYYR